MVCRITSPSSKMPVLTTLSVSGFPISPAASRARNDVDGALRNAEEALALYAEAEAKEGRDLPPPAGYRS